MRIFLVLCCGFLAVAAHAADSEPAADSAQTNPPDVSAKRQEYVPPKGIGAPRQRMVGAATRAARVPMPTLLSLVPEHTGQTISTQPSLFWYLDMLPTQDAPVYFTLTNELQTDPVAEIRLPRVAATGIQRVDLAGFGIELQRGTEYEWTVAVVVDAEHRANDIVTAGWLLVVDPPLGLEPTARSYAAHGLWYDALAAASDSFRAELLAEVGLGDLVPGSEPD